MSKKSGGVNVVGPLMLVLALVIYAFSQGFWTGLNLLGDIINIFGTICLSNKFNLEYTRYGANDNKKMHYSNNNYCIFWNVFK